MTGGSGSWKPRGEYGLASLRKSRMSEVFESQLGNFQNNWLEIKVSKNLSPFPFSLPSDSRGWPLGSYSVNWSCRELALHGWSPLIVSPVPGPVPTRVTVLHSLYCTDKGAVAPFWGLPGAPAPTCCLLHPFLLLPPPALAFRAAWAESCNNNNNNSQLLTALAFACSLHALWEGHCPALADDLGRMGPGNRTACRRWASDTFSL